MANKDHSLDMRIVIAAKKEFLACGYEKASLRKIAAEAGVTVGAIYTRYENKNQLFCSLVAPLIDKVAGAFTELKQVYAQCMEEENGLLNAMQKESETILEILFDDYETAILLLGKGTGSTVEHFMNAVIEKKTEETIEFFKSQKIFRISPQVIKIMILGQFKMYSSIICGGYDLYEAQKLMNAAVIYTTGGWKALFEEA